MTQPGVHDLVVGAEDEGAGERLDLTVARRLGLSRTQAATLVAEGHVLVNGRRERAAFHPAVGDTVRVTVPPPPGRDILPEAIPLTVVHEDAHLLVL